MGEKKENQFCSRQSQKNGKEGKERKLCSSKLESKGEWHEKKTKSKRIGSFKSNGKSKNYERGLHTTTGRGSDLGEVQRVSSVNKCKRFQKANKELIVAAGDTQRGVFQHNQIRARK